MRCLQTAMPACTSSKGAHVSTHVCVLDHRSVLGQRFPARMVAQTCAMVGQKQQLIEEGFPMNRVPAVALIDIVFVSPINLVLSDCALHLPSRSRPRRERA